MADWLRLDGEGNLLLTLHIQPGAKGTAFAGLHGEAMKLRLAAPPVDGKANTALCAFIAEQAGVARRDVSIVSGESARAKRLRIDGGGEAAHQRLLRAAGAA